MLQRLCLRCSSAARVPLAAFSTIPSAARPANVRWPAALPLHLQTAPTLSLTPTLSPHLPALALARLPAPAAARVQ